MSQSPSYFVRSQGIVRGPFTREALAARVAAGLTTPVHFVSEDQANWVSAGSLEWLFPRRSAPIPPVQPVVESSGTAVIERGGDHSTYAGPAGSSGRSGVLAFALAFVGVLIVVAVGLLAWMRLSDATANPKAASPMFVSKFNDEDQLRRAVGFVVTGVTLTTYDGKQIEMPASRGSCFLISPEGYLLTNRHVVQSAIDWSRSEVKKQELLNTERLLVKESIWVFFNGKRHLATLEHVSTKFDMAILKIDAAGLMPVRLLNADTLRLDQELRAVGFPGTADVALSQAEDVVQQLRKEQDLRPVEEHFERRSFEITLTSGRVIRSDFDAIGAVNWIQSDCSTNPGNSGGPLLAAGGAAVGINTEVTLNQVANFSRAISLGQMREEIDRVVQGAQWVDDPAASRSGTRK